MKKLIKSLIIATTGIVLLGVTPAHAETVSPTPRVGIVSTWKHPTSATISTARTWKTTHESSHGLGAH